MAIAIPAILVSPPLRRPLLGPSPGWKRQLELSHLRHSLYNASIRAMTPGAATPVWQVWQLPYLGVWIFQKQVTQWAKSGDIGAKNERKWPKNPIKWAKNQVSASLPSLSKWANAAPDWVPFSFYQIRLWRKEKLNIKAPGASSKS